MPKSTQQSEPVDSQKQSQWDIELLELLPTTSHMRTAALVGPFPLPTSSVHPSRRLVVVVGNVQGIGHGIAHEDHQRDDLFKRSRHQQSDQLRFQPLIQVVDD